MAPVAATGRSGGVAYVVLGVLAGLVGAVRRSTRWPTSTIDEPSVTSSTPSSSRSRRPQQANDQLAAVHCACRAARRAHRDGQSAGRHAASTGPTRCTRSRACFRPTPGYIEEMDANAVADHDQPAAPPPRAPSQPSIEIKGCTTTGHDRSRHDDRAAPDGRRRRRRPRLVGQGRRHRSRRRSASGGDCQVTDQCPQFDITVIYKVPGDALGQHQKQDRRGRLHEPTSDTPAIAERRHRERFDLGACVGVCARIVAHARRVQEWRRDDRSRPSCRHRRRGPRPSSPGFWFLLIAPKRKEAARPRRRRSRAQQARCSQAQQQGAVQHAAPATAYNRDYATVAELGKAVPDERRDPVAARPARDGAPSRPHRLPRDRRGLRRRLGPSPAPPAAATERRRRPPTARRHAARRRRPRPVTASASALDAAPGATVGAGAARRCRSRSSSTATTSTFSASCSPCRTSRGPAAAASTATGRLLVIGTASLSKARRRRASRRSRPSIAATAYRAARRRALPPQPRPATTPAATSGNHGRGRVDHAPPRLDAPLRPRPPDGDAMSFLQSIWTDLVERRLLPVVIAARRGARRDPVRARRARTTRAAADRPRGLANTRQRPPTSRAIRRPSSSMVPRARHGAASRRATRSSSRTLPKPRRSRSSTPSAPDTGNAGGHAMARRARADGPSTPVRPADAARRTADVAEDHAGEPARRLPASAALRPGRATSTTTTTSRASRRCRRRRPVLRLHRRPEGRQDRGLPALLGRQGDRRRHCRPTPTNCQTIEMKEDIEFFDLTGRRRPAPVQYELD